MFGQVVHAFPEVRIDFSQLGESAFSKANIILEKCLLHLTGNDQGHKRCDGGFTKKSWRGSRQQTE